MGRVFRELQERFKRARSRTTVTEQRSVAVDSFGRVMREKDHHLAFESVLSEIQFDRMSAQSASAKGRAQERHAEIKSLLLSLATYTPSKNHTGAHLCQVLQVPDLMDIILREVECKKHLLRPGEKPKLKLLELRYGVTISAILQCNDLGSSEQLAAPMGRTFLYIPPSGCKYGGAEGMIPTRITRSELTAKLRQRSPMLGLLTE